MRGSGIFVRVNAKGLVVCSLLWDCLVCSVKKRVSFVFMLIVVFPILGLVLFPFYGFHFRVKESGEGVLGGELTCVYMSEIYIQLHACLEIYYRSHFFPR